MMENKTKIDLKNKSVFITGVAGWLRQQCTEKAPAHWRQVVGA